MTTKLSKVDPRVSEAYSNILNKKAVALDIRNSISAFNEQKRQELLNVEKEYEIGKNIYH